MSDAPIPPKTPEQIDAEFAEVFKDIHPIVPARPRTWAEKLKPYRKAVMNQRKRGLNWKQIAKGMALKPVLVKVGEKVLRETFGADEKPKTAKAAAASAKDSKPVTLRPNRVILDPTTEQPITSSDWRPSPITPEERQRFGPLFANLIPSIVKTKMKRGAAVSYGSNAVDRETSQVRTRFEDLIEVELDVLDETNCARYEIPPETIAPFKRVWAKERPYWQTRRGLGG